MHLDSKLSNNRITFQYDNINLVLPILKNLKNRQKKKIDSMDL